MTHDDVGFFGKHMEKLILGAGLLVLAAVGFFYIVGDPYQVEIKTVNNRTVEAGPSDVEDHVRDAADKLKDKLDSGDLGFEEPVIPDYKDEAARAYGEIPLEVVSFTAHGPPGPSLVNEGPETGKQWILPNVPMPLDVVAEADYGLVDFDQIFNPNVLADLQNLIGRSVPADVQYGKVAAEFDMDAWAAAFERIPLENRVPDLIYRNSLHITGVYLIRQELNPVSKRWENETTIKPIPGQIAYLPGDGKQFTRESGEAAVSEIRNNQEEVARPSFVPLDPVRPWLPPGSAGPKLNFEQQQELNAMNRKIATLERRVLSLRKRLGLPEELPQADAVRPGGGEEGRFEGEGFEGERFGGERGGERRPPRPRGNDENARLADLERQLIELYGERAEFQRAVNPNALPIIPEGTQELPQAVLDRMTPQERRAYFETGELPNLAGPDGGAAGRSTSGGRVRVWAHDLTVEPGKTYRYKLVVAVRNPLFQNRQLPQEQAEANRDRIALEPAKFEIQAGEWSEPVAIEPKHRFFVVSANPKAHTAEVEVFTIFKGERRREKFNVSPGDPIGQVVQRQFPDGQVFKIDMRVGAFAVDIVSIPGVGGAGFASARMLYQQDGSNRIVTRDIAADKNDRLRQELQFEVNEAEQARAQ